MSSNINILRVPAIRFFILSLVLTTVLLIYAGFKIWNAQKRDSTIRTQMVEIESLTCKIVYYDEALTMTARLCAASGDANWEKRYLRFVDSLDIALATVNELAPKEAMEDFISQTSKANDALIAMETQAFEMVKVGQADAALQLLLGKAYKQEKETYALGMQKLTRSMEGYGQQLAEDYENSTKNFFIIVALISPVIGLGWIVVLRLIASYIKKTATQQQILSEQNQKLEYQKTQLEEEDWQQEGLQKILLELQATEYGFKTKVENLLQKLLEHTQGIEAVALLHRFDRQNFPDSPSILTAVGTNVDKKEVLNELENNRGSASQVIQEGKIRHINGE